MFVLGADRERLVTPCEPPIAIEIVAGAVDLIEKERPVYDIRSKGRGPFGFGKAKQIESVSPAKSRFLSCSGKNCGRDAGSSAKSGLQDVRSIRRLKLGREGSEIASRRLIRHLLEIAAEHFDDAGPILR
jgi:hypothetical protein